MRLILITLFDEALGQNLGGAAYTIQLAQVFFKRIRKFVLAPHYLSKIVTFALP